MAPLKKYFLNIMFLVSPMTACLYAQSTVATPVCPTIANAETTSVLNQNNNATADVTISNLDNSNQFIVGLPIPKGSLASTGMNSQNTTSIFEDKSLLTGSYSALAKDIIENYKYDFSETFIDILFFEDIDLARKRTI
jgi:hypothetical protein